MNTSASPPPGKKARLEIWKFCKSGGAAGIGNETTCFDIGAMRWMTRSRSHAASSRPASSLATRDSLSPETA